MGEAGRWRRRETARQHARDVLCSIDEMMASELCNSVAFAGRLANESRNNKLGVQDR